MAQIPMTADVAEIIGPFAERVENRSLLLDKFVFHKSWPCSTNDRGEPVKWDDASRWSFMRIAEGSGSVLLVESNKKIGEAGGRNVDPEKAARLRQQAELAQKLSRVKWDDAEIALLRSRHTRRFVTQFRQTMGAKASVIIAQLEARLAINLSDSLIQNAGICLDRLFGLPYIPGSAIKGVCRHAALEQLGAAQGEAEKRRLFRLFMTIFGTSTEDFKKELSGFARFISEEEYNQKGAVDFLPAYPVNQAKIAVDLTTVHYPEYYHSGRTEDLSKEKPRPNPFPVVESGVRFAVCLVANGMDEAPETLQTAVAWMKTALTVRGVGAKTACGYGWFSIPESALQEMDEEERRDRETAEEVLRQEAERKARKDREACEALEAAKRAAANQEAKQRLAAMTPEQVAEETVASWDTNLFNARLIAFVKPKGGPSEAEKKAMVRSLHTRHTEAWLAFKTKAQKGELAKIRDVIVTVNKQLGLGKLP